MDEHMNFSASTSDDLAFDTPSSSDEQSQEALELRAHDNSPPHSPHESRKRTPQPLNLGNGYVPGVHASMQEMGPLGSMAADLSSSLGLTTTKKQNSGAWSLDRQLSMVEEVRTPSPKVESHRTFGESLNIPKFGSSQTNGDKAEGFAEKPLAMRPNGNAPSSGTTTNSGPNTNHSNAWHTQKKKKKGKKANKSDNDAQAINTLGGESLPADESLRKGG
jgi:hypothetical protein